MSVPIHDSGLLALSVPLLENMKQKKKKEGTYHHVIVWILSSLTLCLLLSILSLPIFVLYIISRFFNCTWNEGIGKTTSTPSSQGGSAELLFSFTLYSLPVEYFEDKMRTSFILLSSAPGHDCTKE